MAAPVILLAAVIQVGEVFTARLPCSPTTGYAWELKSVDRKIAVSTGRPRFEKSPAAPGAVGAPGECVVGLKGVAPGKTEAVFVYRRPWEKKKAPLKTATAELTVVLDKAP